MPALLFLRDQIQSRSKAALLFLVAQQSSAAIFNRAAKQRYCGGSLGERIGGRPVSEPSRSGRDERLPHLDYEPAYEEQL